MLVESNLAKWKQWKCKYLQEDANSEAWLCKTQERRKDWRQGENGLNVRRLIEMQTI